MRAWIIIACLVLVGCSHKPNFIIPDQKPMDELYAIFIEEGDRYYTDELGFKSMEKRDELTSVYIEELKSRLRMCNEEI